MTIKALNNYNFSKNNISFSRKTDKKEPRENSNKLEHKPQPAIARGYKMLPAAAVLAGLTTLSSCTESDFRYKELRDVKEQYFSEVSRAEKNLSKVNEKTFVLSTEKDSVFKETDDFKYSHVRIKSQNHTRVFGEILRKKDGKEIKFINVYDENDKLTSSTLKDPETNETFYVSYENGFLNEIHDKDGKEIPSSKYTKYLLLLGIAIGFYGVGRAASEVHAKKMTNREVPFIEPPPLKEKDD